MPSSLIREMLTVRSSTEPGVLLPGSCPSADGFVIIGFVSQDRKEKECQLRSSLLLLNLACSHEGLIWLKSVV